MCLKDKMALITGAGSGIVRASAILFAKERAKVVVNDVNVEGGKETVNQVKEVGGEASFIKANVSKAEEVRRMIKFSVDTYGRLDVLYNNAAVSLFGPPAPPHPLGQDAAVCDLSEDN